MCKWNPIKHEKAKHSSFLRELCSIDGNEEDSLHREFSRSITEADAKYIRQIIDYIKERFNPFAVDEASEIVNIVTMSHVQTESRDFLMQCLELGDTS